MIVFVIFLSGLTLCHLSPSFVEPYHRTVGIELHDRIRTAEEAGIGDELKSRMSGFYTELGDHPYLAGLIIELQDGRGKSVGSAALITGNRLLTAAHLWWDGDTRAFRFEVVMGTKHLLTGGIRQFTDQMDVHEDFDYKTRFNDIGVLSIPTSIDETDYAKPALLPFGRFLEESFYLYWAHSTGFGKNHPYGVLCGQYRKTSIAMRVNSNKECASAYNYIYSVPDSIICAQTYKGNGPCRGDGGAPLTIEYPNNFILIGVFSFTQLPNNITCQTGQPTAYTRVTHFMTWITARL